MGLFGSLKQAMGIGGVTLLIQTPSSNFTRGGGEISGTIELTSKTDQNIVTITAKVQEVVSRNVDGHEQVEEFDLGIGNVSGPMEIKAGESKSIPFAVTYSGGRTLADGLQAQGGKLGMLGKIGAVAGNEQLQYRLNVHAKVAGSMLGSGHHLNLAPIDPA